MVATGELEATAELVGALDSEATAETVVCAVAVPAAVTVPAAVAVPAADTDVIALLVETGEADHAAESEGDPDAEFVAAGVTVRVPVATGDAEGLPEALLELVSLELPVPVTLELPVSVALGLAVPVTLELPVSVTLEPPVPVALPTELPDGCAVAVVAAELLGDPVLLLLAVELLLPLELLLPVPLPEAETDAVDEPYPLLDSKGDCVAAAEVDGQLEIVGGEEGLDVELSVVVLDGDPVLLVEAETEAELLLLTEPDPVDVPEVEPLALADIDAEELLESEELAVLVGDAETDPEEL